MCYIVHNTIEVEQVKLTLPFKDNLWVEIKLVGTDSLLVGCMYRSPNSLRWKSDPRKPHGGNPHLLIMDDFNFPHINWTTWVSPYEEESQLIEAAQDGFLFQHIKKPTHVWGTDGLTLLDLIFSNEEGMVSHLEIHSPMVKVIKCVYTFCSNARTF